MLNFFYSKKCLFIFIFLFIISVLININLYNKQNNNNLDYNCNYNEIVNIDEENVDEMIFVDVKGAVKKPGVYNIKSGSIVFDVIKMAGGFKSNAYQNNINLSKILQNEMVIYIYTQNEFKERDEEIKYNATIDEDLSQKDSIMVPEKENTSNSSSLININSAEKVELMTLSGIGESKALNIINYRNSNGLFTNINDLKNVDGIGETIFEQIKNNITI